MALKKIINFFYIDKIIDEVASYKMYSFIDCFSRYYQIAMALKEKKIINKWKKTTFSIEWMLFQLEQMSFDTKNILMML